MCNEAWIVIVVSSKPAWSHNKTVIGVEANFWKCPSLEEACNPFVSAKIGIEYARHKFDLFLRGVMREERY